MGRHKGGPHPPEVRFWFHVAKSDDCWLWTGAKFRKGYGNFCVYEEGRNVSAHRYAWELENGPIPEGMYLCHECDTPACVRPDHMFIGTQADNLADMTVKGRRVSSFAWLPRDDQGRCITARK